MTISGSISWIIARMESRYEHRRTLRLLSSMTEQQLLDVGLTRGDIETVARSAFDRRIKGVAA
jgi:uncharacterized protein YjiS (DUF1127 family)